MFRYQALRRFSTSGLGNKSDTSWGRSARTVQNTDITSEYWEHVRAKSDPALHVKTIEEELCGEMGKALGKQGGKVENALYAMGVEQKQYKKLMEGDPKKWSEEILASATRYNSFREIAVKARWELVVHRQAVGFIVNNHKLVHERYPIGDPLPVIDSISNCDYEKQAEQIIKPPQDQLKYWERICR
mmetsp:Transcript_59690/g.69767  ORF Transcript_59690/g.69767 Transcript_59690/m.69767 type:complete len:187 (-) Transcript_59690:184-744(-)